MRYMYGMLHSPYTPEDNIILANDLDMDGTSKFCL